MIVSILRNKIKKNKVLVSVIGQIGCYLFPRSNITAYSYYTRGLYKEALERIINPGKLSLMIEYRLNQKDKVAIEKFILDKQEELKTHIYSLPYDMINDYVLFCKFTTPLDKINDKVGNVKVLYCELISAYHHNSPYLGHKNSHTLLVAMYRADRFIFKNFGVKDYYISQVIDRQLNFKPNAYFDTDKIFLDIINCLDHVKPNPYLSIVKSTLNYIDADQRSDYFRSIFPNLEKAMNKRDILKIISHAKNEQLYLDYFPRLKSVKLKYWVEYWFFTQKTQYVLNLVKFLKCIKCDHALMKVPYLMLSILDADPIFANDYIEYRKKFGLGIPSYSILSCLYNGRVKEAELARQALRTSLQAHINTYYTVFSQSNFWAAHKILIVAEQGVADEVRWARLYGFINSLDKDVTIVCDPRLINVFRASFKNINFLGHKRKFRPEGMNPFDFNENNIPRNACEYDFIMSTSMLFLIDEIDIATTHTPYLINAASIKEKAVHEIKIGLLWSSSLTTGVRGYRYGIPQAAITYLIEELSSLKAKVSYYCLQSPIQESDKSFCAQSGINLVNDVDLYNDFDSTSQFLKQLDYVVGPSSLLTELSAALGTTFLHMANAPEIAMMRNGRLADFTFTDQLSNCTMTMTPKYGYIDRTKDEINNDVIDTVVSYILSVYDEKTK